MGGTFALPAALRLGTVLDPARADGGVLEDTWQDWYRKGYIRDGADPGTAAGHYTRWREDALLMRRMGLDSCRVGVQWARVEPQEGQFDAEALEHLKQELLYLRGLHIAPLLVLQQFSVPLWFQEKGGWKETENAELFLRYVRRVVSTVGHLCAEYVTLCQPNLYARLSYEEGQWPPGEHSGGAADRVMSVLAMAHLRSYRLIHDLRRSLGFRDTRCGFVLDVRVFRARNRTNPLYLAAAARLDDQYQTQVAEALMRGRFSKPLTNLGRLRAGRYCDFLGLAGGGLMAVGAHGVGLFPGSRRDALDQAIYPAGLLECARRLLKIRQMPLYLIGGPVGGEDALRCRVIQEQLAAVAATELPVERYYFDSFTDGFQWTAGESVPVGLLAVDFTDMGRSLRPSGQLYAAICRDRALTEETRRAFLAPENEEEEK